MCEGHFALRCSATHGMHVFAAAWTPPPFDDAHTIHQNFPVLSTWPRRPAVLNALPCRSQSLPCPKCYAAVQSWRQRRRALQGHTGHAASAQSASAERSLNTAAAVPLSVSLAMCCPCQHPGHRTAATQASLARAWWGVQPQSMSSQWSSLHLRRGAS